jgi:hypothetical protein
LKLEINSNLAGPAADKMTLGGLIVLALDRQSWISAI